MYLLTYLFSLIGLTAIFVPIEILLGGWVLSVLWGWFIVPTFGAPALNIVPAIGLSVMIRVCLTQRVSGGESDAGMVKDGKMVRVARAIVPPAVLLYCLFIGWIVHLFM